MVPHTINNGYNDHNFKDKKVTSDENKVILEKIKRNKFGITIEPLMFAVMFVTSCSSSVTIDVIERNLYCRSHGGNCTWNRSNEEIRNSLNLEAAQVNMFIRLFQGICPLLITMFIGPWSDKNGRKPFMIFCLAGYLCFSSLWAVMSLFPMLSPYAFIIPSITLSLSGGQLALYLCCYCYISDITEHQNRAVRFSMMHSSSMVGNLIGCLCIIFIEWLCHSKDSIYVYTFSCCSLVSLLGFIYALCYLEETVEKKERMDSLFNLEFAKSVAKFLLAKSPSDLIITLLTIFILFFDICIKKGEKAILYLVVLDQFAWSLSHFNAFSIGIIFVSALTSSGVPIFLKKWLGWQNLSIVLFASVTVCLSEILRSLSKSEVDFWVLSSLTTLTTLTAPAINAEISALACKEDMGKIYAFNALIDSLVPYVAVSVYSQVYRFLVPSHEALSVYLVSAASAIIIGILAVVLVRLKYIRDHLPALIKHENFKQCSS